MYFSGLLWQVSSCPIFCQSSLYYVPIILLTSSPTHSLSEGFGRKVIFGHVMVGDLPVGSPFLLNRGKLTNFLSNVGHCMSLAFIWPKPHRTLAMPRWHPPAHIHSAPRFSSPSSLTSFCLDLKRKLLLPKSPGAACLLGGGGGSLTLSPGSPLHSGGCAPSSWPNLWLSVFCPQGLPPMMCLLLSLWSWIRASYGSCWPCSSSYL
jgi:hypothetical protein